MARRTTADPYRQIKVSAEVEAITPTDSYSSDSVTLATLETKVRLGGRFDREAVTALVTGIVNQLIDAFDEGETTLLPDPDEAGDVGQDR